ncbi:aldo/keto reductase [uncultured Sphingomonas sp.]|uniref:aldo/keto reductase n=1 Tax=uncultured Sphingomonas sp. TaxID=158754 RepID=UPI0035CB1B68
MTLDRYRPLGRSGLIVSPLALGTMTFGTGGWGSDEAASRAIYDAYVGAGGNFIDTADVYASGGGEEMVGGFIADAKARDRIVLATKSGFPFERGHPHVGGNGAKHVRAAVEGSLRRLGTDHIDLYWVHVWDQVTPAEELLDTMVNLVRAGHIRYFGLSNVPAWYATKMATLAAAHGRPGPIALQFEYSLAERGIEYEHAAVAREFGMGLVPWSPLAGGFLSGKYRREDARDGEANAPGLPSAATGDTPPTEGGRLNGANPFGDTKFTDRNWDILDVLHAVADEIGAPPAQVALAWVAGRPGVDSTLIGASRPDQVAGNIAALDVALSPDQRDRLDTASAPPMIAPFSLASPFIRKLVFGGTDVATR